MCFCVCLGEKHLKPKCETLAALTEVSERQLSLSSNRVLGRVGDEQRHSWVSPATLHRGRGPGPATPPSGGGRGGHGGGAGARPILVLDPQWRHGKDPAGRPA